ncbi:YkgJ family cysteine cluster protein [bacterium]|nr:YkgJ family cysteine cluster protein [bacterium]
MDNVLGEKDICSRCGKCCRLLPSGKSYAELCSLAEKGDKTASNFLKLFLPHKSIDDALLIDENYVKQTAALNKKKFGNDYETYFYYCRYLNDDNTCKVYDMRPKLCKNYPKNAFTVIPEDCAYEGYLFEARENIKKYVRKTKEELMEISILKKDCNTPNELRKYENLEKKYIMLIDKYRAYGSEDW